PGLGPEGAWGSRALRDAFFAVALLEEAEWTGIRHLAAGPAARDLGELRTQAQGRIGTYLLLRAKVAELVGDPEIADARAAAGAERLAEGKRTATHSILCRDRDRPNVYLQIVEFPSYEDAMRNNEMPETADFASRVMALCDGEAQFHNLDLVDEASW